MSQKLVLKVSESKHNRLIEHAKSILKKRQDLKWEVCKIALELCHIKDKKGGRYDDLYSITNFADDVGMNRKTLSDWIADYQLVVVKVGVPQTNSLQEARMTNNAIKKTRLELFNLNTMGRKEADRVPKQVIEKTLKKHMSGLYESHKLFNFNRNILNQIHFLTNYDLVEIDKKELQSYLNNVNTLQKSARQIIEAILKIK